jgi:hypothetical protein
MILLALLFASAAQSNSQEQVPTKFKETTRAYMECVRSSAMQFERAKESVPVTVDAAFSACANERAGHIFAIMDIQKSHGTKEPSIRSADSQVRELIDVNLRDELIAKLMRLRAGAR